MVTWNIDEPGGVIKLIKHLAIYSLVTELIGMICLCLSFYTKIWYRQRIIFKFIHISISF